MINDERIILEYRNTLNIMLQGDKELAGLIEEFFQQMPTRAKNKVFSRGRSVENTTGYATEENGQKYIWQVYRGPDGRAWINKREKRRDSVQHEKITMEFISLTSWQILNWPREMKKEIGCVKLYVYKGQDNFYCVELNFVVEKIGDKLVMKIENDKINSGADYEEYLKNNGCYDIVKNCAGSKYIIDVSRIVPMVTKR